MPPSQQPAGGTSAPDVSPAQPRVSRDPEAATSLAAQVGPFAAWLATQDIDEPTRRAHREAVEAFLRWNHHHQRPGLSRREGYEQVLDNMDAQQATSARAGLQRFADYRALVAITLPPNH